MYSTIHRYISTTLLFALGGGKSEPGNPLLVHAPNFETVILHQEHKEIMQRLNMGKCGTQRI